jgi:hypothetical protein
MISRSLRRAAALAAVFALSLQALWPLLAQAQPATQTLLVPLCGVEGGSHSIDIKTGKKDAAGEHCKLCLLGDGKDAAPFAPVHSPFLLETSSNAHPRPVEASLRLAPSSPAQPRAPPQAS